ncbi:MAG TPA: acetate--CoA ligase [Pirellulales bacterium]|nr:acetate--CoA ligase [Pirellulales bacterium]
MRWEPIVKSERDWKASPNLRDYDQARADFDWGSVRRPFYDSADGQSLNIAYEAVDRHAAGPLRDKIAIRWLGMAGTIDDFTYRRLQDLTNRFAGALKSLGVGKGDRVFVLARRIPELYIAALGALKNRSVFCPLFSAFGPEPIKTRLSIGGANVLVTTSSLYERKIAGIRAELPSLEHVILINDNAQPVDAPGAYDYHALMEAASDRFTIEATAPDDFALLHFVSSATGAPKGAAHGHEAVVAHHASAQLALDLRPEDVFWCTADPGLATGTFYGIIAPLAIGATSIVDEGDFDADCWYGIVQAHRVSVWYTAPTAIRMMMREGVEATKNYDLSSLRFLASAGEPLSPEAVLWGREAFGLPFHDNWRQTETGGIMIANYAAMDIRPGSMGRPLPGVEAAIVRLGDDGRVNVVNEPGVEGELALRPGWPSMFCGYWNEPERYRKRFAGGYYLTGDLAKRDADGYFWFVGRKEDVIESSGILIGPFEVESALREHPAVAEAGVIGKPDPVALEIVKAFVAVKPGFEPSNALARELLSFAHARLGDLAAPKELSFISVVPKNRAGNVMRRLLKAREPDLAGGDARVLDVSGE